MLVLSGCVCDCSSEQDRAQIWLVAAVALITIILALTLCGLFLRQLTRTKKNRRNSEAILSVEDVPAGYEYDVFLSFRGQDTRNNFTDCLYCELRRVGVHVFLDNEELRVGKEISGELLKALDKSHIYIPIFSKNYATSSWCLREVAHMVEGTEKSNGKKDILPIFYDVHPDDVKLKTKLYNKAIAKHKKKFSSDALNRWKDALGKVAHLKGWELEGKGHGELIKLVVGEVLRKLNARHVDVPEYWVEDHCQIENILEKLEVDFDGVRFLGIHGIGGIGKTILARVVFNKISSHFEGVCFLNDVRESSQHGLISVQKKLLASFVGPANADQIKDVGDGMNQIKRVCHNQKVLIVLDDLDKQEQLKKLAGKSDWFGSGSRIIFTTRNLEVLMTQVESSCEDVLYQPKGTLAYEVHEMEFAQALQLFCKHAFRRDSPPEGYDHLPKKIVHRVGMLPLAVEAIGSFLYCHGFALEQHCDKKNLWEDTLKRLDDGPFKDVRDALMISYEGLENKQKEVFLDIACLFTNKDQTYPVIMWDECNYHPHIAISVLRQRSLIKIGHDNKFWMHDQVRDLGKHIMREEYPCKFSRVYINEDAMKLLERKERNEDVKALCLTSDVCNHNFGSEKLAASPDLSLLQVEGIDIFCYCWKLNRGWLSWAMKHNNYAENLHLSNLLELKLSGNYVDTMEQLPVVPMMPGGNTLMRVIGELDNNEKVIYKKVTFFPTIREQDKVTFKVAIYSFTIREQDCHLCLEIFNVSKVYRMTTEQMQKQVQDPEGLDIFEDYHHKISRQSIYEGAIKSLDRKETLLNLYQLSCLEILTNYPENFHFGVLILPNALGSNIKDDWERWMQIQRNEDGKAISMTSDSCSRNIGPEELAALSDLRFLRVEGTDFIGNFKNVILKLSWLSWEVTHNKFYAENFHFASLVVLDLSRSNIEDDWGGWSQFQQMTKKLKVLDLKDCKKLTRTPDVTNFMSLEILVLAGCVSLITIDCSIGKLEFLKTLNIKGCVSLGKLPPEVGSLPSLKIVRDPGIGIIDPMKSFQKQTRLRNEEFLRLSEIQWPRETFGKPLLAGVWANLTRLSLHGSGGTKALLERLDNLDFRPDILIEVYP